MIDAPVRLAFVGPPEDVAGRVSQLRRVQGAVAAIVANSLEAAVQAEVEFDAVIAHSFVEAADAVAAHHNVLVDAPVAESIDQVRELLVLAEQNDAHLCVGSLPRNTPACQTIINRLIGGKLGDPGLLRVHRWSSRQQSLAAKTFGDLDLAMHLFGALPTDVYAVERSRQAYVQIHLGFPRGGMAILDYSERMPLEQKYDSLSLIGSTGAAYVDDHHNSHLVLTGRKPTALISDSGSSYVLEFQSFVEEICGVSSPRSQAEEILNVHRVVSAVRNSIASAQVLRQHGADYEPA